MSVYSSRHKECSLVWKTHCLGMYCQHQFWPTLFPQRFCVILSFSFTYSTPACWMDFLGFPWDDFWIFSTLSSDTLWHWRVTGNNLTASPSFLFHFIKDMKVGCLLLLQGCTCSENSTVQASLTSIPQPISHKTPAAMSHDYWCLSQNVADIDSICACTACLNLRNKEFQTCSLHWCISSVIRTSTSHIMDFSFIKHLNRTPCTREKCLHRISMKQMITITVFEGGIVSKMLKILKVYEIYCKQHA